MGAAEIELAIHRKGTEQFIAKDPTTLTLIPTTEVEDAGSVSYEDQGPRPEQIFKVIYNDIQGQVPSGEGNTTHRFDFILVGRHDAAVAIGDHWTEGDQHYVIEWVAPYNGYEVKAGGTSHGPDPAHG